MCGLLHPFKAGTAEPLKPRGLDAIASTPRNSKVLKDGAEAGLTQRRCHGTDPPTSEDVPMSVRNPVSTPPPAGKPSSAPGRRAGGTGTRDNPDQGACLRMTATVHNPGPAAASVVFGT